MIYYITRHQLLFILASLWSSDGAWTAQNVGWQSHSLKHSNASSASAVAQFSQTRNPSVDTSGCILAYCPFYVWMMRAVSAAQRIETKIRSAMGHQTCSFCLAASCVQKSHTKSRRLPTSQAFPARQSKHPMGPRSQSYLDSKEILMLMST